LLHGGWCKLAALIVRAAPFVNGIAVLAEDKAPALGWLADAEMALPGLILTEPGRYDAYVASQGAIIDGPPIEEEGDLL
jgi:hypothetical protein